MTDSDVMIIEGERTPSPVKKPKQLTLFDMAKKANRSINNENQIPKPSPKAQFAENANKPKKGPTKTQVLKSVDHNKSNKENDPETGIKEETKKSGKISDFFSPSAAKSSTAKTDQQCSTGITKSDQNEVTDFLVMEEAPKKPVPTITDLIKRIAKRPLADDMASINVHFGSLLSIVELYNSIGIPLFKDQLKRFGFKKLKLQPLVRSLVGHPDADKGYFLNTIKRLLTIFIDIEGVLSKSSEAYDFDFRKTGLKTPLIQELTRMTLNALLSEVGFPLDPPGSVVPSEFDLAWPSDAILRNFKIMKKLEKNWSSEPFGELSTEDKIELLLVLCEQLLSTKTFRDHEKNLENQLEKLKSSVKGQQEALAEKLEMPLSDFYKNKHKLYKDIMDSTLSKDFGKKKAVKLIQKKQDEIKSVENQLALTYRKEPLCRDLKSNAYWQFSWLNEILVEIIDDLESGTSEWYMLDLDCLKTLIDELQMKFEHNPLKKSLWTVYNEMKPKAEDEQGEEKDETRKISIKRASEVLAELNSSDDESEEEIVQKKIRTRRSIMNAEKKADEPSCYEIPFLEIDQDSYSFDNFTLDLANLWRLMRYLGVMETEKKKDDQLKQLFTDYNSSASDQEKMNSAKSIALSLYHAIPYKQMRNNGFKKCLFCGERFLYRSLERAIETTNSLSALCFAIFYLLANMKTMNSIASKICEKCKKFESKSNHHDFEKKSSLQALKEIKDEQNHFRTCFDCQSLFHLDCDEGRISKSFTWTCSKCGAKKGSYTYEEVSNEANLKAETENDLSKSTRKTRALRARRDLDKDDISNSSTTSTSSNKSLDNGPADNKRRKKASYSMMPQPERKSDRLNGKKVVYTIDSDSE